MNSRTATLAILEVGVSAILSCAGALWWRIPAPLWTEGIAWNVIGQELVPVMCVASAFYYADLYDFRTVRNFAEFCSHFPRALSGAVIFSVMIYAVFSGLNPELHGLPVNAGGLILALLLSVLCRCVLYAFVHTSVLAERVLILGAGPLAWKIAEEMASTSPVADEIIGFVSEGDAPYRQFAMSKRPVLGSLEQLGHIITDVRPDRVIVALTERRGRLPVRVLLDARMKGIVVEDGIEVHERLSGKLAIESLSPSFLIFSKDFKKSRIQTALRGAVSSIVALVGLVLFSPLMAILASVIKMDSLGPVFFIQERAGIGGRPFCLVKFRTMHPDTHAPSAWELDNQYRVTRVGRWLRRFRLDELPQFINVLRGDMNLVGPRPHPVSNYQFFLEKIPYYSLRSTVRPGITGWAQVCYAYANNLEEETEKMRYDLFYIKNLSLWLDLRILVGTIKAVLFGKNGEKPLQESMFDAEKVDNKVVALKGRGPDSVKSTVASLTSGTPREVDLREMRRRSA
ncbi:MAG: exopolysaccharide biosynthesis polyprenyl glycosylphosphotransferase [Candidatus Binatia bacterium]